jgi:serine/threonine protein kinase
MSTGTGSLFCASALASGLTHANQLDYCIRVARHRQSQQGLAADCPLPDRLLADILVEQEVLTAYQADQLLEGRTKLNLGPYVITDWIGQGGMGQVFKAVHQLMGRECAVKVLPLTRATQEARDNFRREIRMQAGLDCPYLVRAFDAGQDGNVHFLVTEYVPGMDLRQLVKSHGALPIQQAAKIIMQAALGLDYAHQKGLVHRDVKPGNILVTPAGDAKVSDVGLAGFAKDLINDPRAGKIVGTTDYLSPEQIRTPLEIQPASDIYSLGCTLYYAVCGKVPFPGGDTTSKLRRHLEETPWHPRRFASDITEDFVDIIADMMEKDVKKRITSAVEVASRLEPWVGDAMGMSGLSMTRSPWMAPPPPSHEEDKTADTARSLQFSERTNSQFSGSDGALADGPPAKSSDTADSQQKLPFPDLVRNDIGPQAMLPDHAAGSSHPRSTGAGLSPGMVIALTIAIVVPPALLAGAILGYLAAR